MLRLGSPPKVGVSGLRGEPACPLPTPIPNFRDLEDRGEVEVQMRIRFAIRAVGDIREVGDSAE